MTYFNNPTTLQELRDQYKKLALRFHPDISGFESTKEMQLINNEYDSLTKDIASGSKFSDSEIEFSELYKEKISVLIKIKGLTVELIGNWIWVSGNTKEHKELLKEMKFRFAPKKIAWYFKNYEYRKTTKEVSSLDELRDTFGSKSFSNSDANNEKLILS